MSCQSGGGGGALLWFGYTIERAFYWPKVGGVSRVSGAMNAIVYAGLGVVFVIGAGMLVVELKDQIGSSASDQKEVETFDAYEAKLVSVVDRVREVLDEKEDCGVELDRNQGSLILKRWGKEAEKKTAIEPVLLTVGKTVELNSGPGKEVLTVPQLAQRLEIYASAVRAAGEGARVNLWIRPEVDDGLFRGVLRKIVGERIDGAYIKFLPENAADKEGE